MPKRTSICCKMRESCVYVYTIILCVESKSSESMVGIVVDEIERKNYVASTNKK